MRFQQARTRIGERGHDACFETEASNLIGDDEVDAFGKFDASGQPFDRDKPIRHPVGCRELAPELHDAPVVHRVDAACAGLAGQESENAGAGGEIENGVIGSNQLPEGGLERAKPHVVSEQLAMFVEDE